MNKLTRETVQNMSYIEFVGLINQWNTLPGSYTTLSKWAAMSRMNSYSHILEVACTTGFSLREIATLTDCSGVGFDLSERSVEMAKYNHERYAKDAKISYHVANGMTTEFGRDFSHIIIGASLGFFPSPDDMLRRCVSWLKDGGYVLASPFYAARPVPDLLIEHCKKVFNITITAKPYHEILRPYRLLETIFEERNAMVQESGEEIEQYVSDTVNRACDMLGVQDDDVKMAMKERLIEIKNASNALREFQEYSVLVLRYRSDVFPNRFAELF